MKKPTSRLLATSDFHYIISPLFSLVPNEQRCQLAKKEGDKTKRCVIASKVSDNGSFDSPIFASEKPHALMKAIARAPGADSEGRHEILAEVYEERRR